MERGCTKKNGDAKRVVPRSNGRRISSAGIKAQVHGGKIDDLAIDTTRGRQEKPFLDPHMRSSAQPATICSKATERNPSISLVVAEFRRTVWRWEMSHVIRLGNEGEVFFHTNHHGVLFQGSCIHPLDRLRSMQRMPSFSWPRPDS